MKNNNIKVAVSQYSVPQNHKDAFQKAFSIVTEASKQKVDLIVLPETALGMLADVKRISISYFDDVKKIAKKNRVSIATSFYNKGDNNKIYNVGVLVDRNGNLTFTYKKIYLAPPERDIDKISPGNKLKTALTPLGKIGMLICKDGFTKYSHFLYLKYGKLHTDIIVVPTWSLGTFKINTEEYIKTSITYGAFLSRCYILVAGNTNKETKSFGQSMIIDPIDGIIKIGSRSKEELLIKTIDINKIKLAREFDKKWQPKKRVL